MKRKLVPVLDGIDGVGEKKRAAILLSLRKADLGGMTADDLSKKIKKETGVSAEASQTLAQKIFTGLPG